jgi:hypothetical protein
MTEEKAQAEELPRTRTTGRRIWMFRMTAILLALVFSFVMIEVAARMILAIRPNDIEALRRFDHAKRAGGDLKLIHFVRISDNPRLVYEMIPEIEGFFHNVPVKINSAGFADRERTVAKPAGTFRIAAIGDSILFGWGAVPDSRYTDVLERFLNDTATTPARFEVLNFGVPGYNTVMEAELLRRRVLSYGPDAVVLGYCADNDTSLPNFVSKPRPLFTLTHSYALDLLRTQGVASARMALEGGVQYSDPGFIPPEYRFLVGWDKAAVAMREIRDMAVGRKIPVVYLRDYYNVEPFRDGGSSPVPDPGADADGLATELGFVPAAPVGEMVRFLDANGYHSYALCVDPDKGDAHPNAIRHALLAKSLYDVLLAKRLLPDSEERFGEKEEIEERWRHLIDGIHKAARIPENYRRRDATLP